MASKKEIFDDLCEIAESKPEYGGSPLICCDLVDQEHLFEIQNKLAILLLKLADDVGQSAHTKLQKDMGYAFTAEPQG